MGKLRASSWDVAGCSGLELCLFSEIFESIHAG